MHGDRTQGSSFSGSVDSRSLLGYDGGIFRGGCDRLPSWSSTLAELRALGIPALVVPWLKAAGQHQVSNAQYFSKLTGAPVFLEGSSQEQFRAALQSVAERRMSCENLNAGAVNLYEALRSLTV